MTEGFEDLTERVSQLRGGHTSEPLELDDLDPDPLVQFASWLEEALEAHPGWPNAMTLATADAKGSPSARIVLLKAVDENGFTFYTNLSSRKGRELEQNPHAALVFYWPMLERQVGVRGVVVKVSDSEADEYFATRPLDSKLGAWASEQSAPLASREELEGRVAANSERFGTDVPRPPHWSGFRLTPTEMEFWKARSNRLHDRFLYKRDSSGWSITRLNP